MANYISYITLVLCFSTAVFFYKKLEPTWLRYFTWYLLFTLLIELLAGKYSYYTHKSNHFIFNVFILVQFLFYFFVFFKTFEKKQLKSMATLMAAMFVIFYLYHIFFAGIYTFMTEVNSFGSILILICCLLYFVFLFYSEIRLNYFRIPMFWIATALLFYFIGNFLYLSLLGYILKNNLDKNGDFFVFTLVTLDLLLYGLFTVGLLSNQLWKKEI